jgi:hypothetical protein
MFSPELTGAAGIGTGRFEDYFTQDLLHHIDSAYRTIADRSGRGIDGFSLGGYTAVMIGLKHPELFSSVGCYDGTHMWHNLDDPRNSGTPPDDNTWMTTPMFNAAFGSPRDVDYMKTYNAVNIILGADSATLALIRTVSFNIHTAAFDGSQGNLDRGNHVVNTLLGKNILNGFPDIRLTSTAVHNWHHADLHASSALIKHWQKFQAATSVVEEPPALPGAVRLEQNYPNPFNAFTTIRFHLSVRGPAKLEVRDVVGRSIALLAEGILDPGRHEILFDGSALCSGVYFVALRAGAQLRITPVLLIK